jgi:rhodanese-related sulfurtransferase
VAALLIALTGCGRGTSDRSLLFLDPPDANDLLEGRTGLLGLRGPKPTVLVDCRRETEFDQEHIPDAINLPFAQVSTDHSILRQYDVIIVYGARYNDPVALGMSKRLLELGHKDVRTLRGGLEAWIAAGYPVDGEGAAEWPEGKE